MDINNVKKIICHDSCPDGLAAAMIVRDAIQHVEIDFVQYNTPEHRAIRPQPGLLFLDFSPFVPNIGPSKEMDREVLHAWASSGSMILDHHKGSKAIVDAFGENGHFGDEVADPGMCGAALAFEHVWKPMRSDSGIDDDCERFARLAGIRDTWIRDSPDWKAACRQADILMFVPRERWLNRPLSEHLVNWDYTYGWIGEILEAKQKRSVEKAISGGLRHTTKKGTRIIIFENVKVTSDVSDQLTDVDLVVGCNSFMEKDEHGNDQLKTVYSTRARGNFDCLGFAKLYGGGGHSKAAGFSITGGTTEHPFMAAIRRLSEFEG